MYVGKKGTLAKGEYFLSHPNVTCDYDHIVTAVVLLLHKFEQDLMRLLVTLTNFVRKVKVL